MAAVVTPLGVYRKVDGDLVLSGVYGDESNVDGAVRAAREACGWELRCARDIVALPLPDAAEREALRRFDPMGDFWHE